MEFKLSDLELQAIDYDVALEPGEVQLDQEAEQSGLLEASGRAEVLHEHRGPRQIVADIRLRGRFQGSFDVRCARCVEPVAVPLAAEYDLIFRPADADASPGERSITAPETEIGYYQGDGLLLEDVLREQILLALPVRTLCQSGCKGLCPSCGENRNHNECNCAEKEPDSRWEALGGLRGKMKE